MKKILVISNTAFSIEKFREHYLSKIKDYKFIIYTPNKIARLKKRYKNIEQSKFYSKNIYQDFIELYNIFKFNNPSEIIVYSYKYQFIVTLLKKIFSFDYDVISLIAGRGSLQMGNIFEKYLFNRITKLILKNSDINICINPEDKKFFNNFLHKKNLVLLPTEGVENIKFRNHKNKKKNFLFFGRIIKEKGVEDYINSAKIIKKKYPNTNFFIAGPIDQSIIGQSKFDKNLLRFVFKNQKYVKYLGYIKDYSKIFPKMDCLISPSHSEGAGTSVMEAMISGLYIIAYKNSGHNYVLKNTFNKICKNNNLNNLVYNIENFLNLDDEIINKARKLSYKKIVNNFTATQVANKFKKILDTKYKIKNENIDIIWPFYKDYKFLDVSISYLNKQTLKPKRLIFIDDGNKDDNLKKYIRRKLNKDIDFIFINNKKNKGVTDSIELGLKKIKSKYFYIKASDDIIYDNFFEINVRFLENYKDTAYTFSNIKINNLKNKKKYFIKFQFINKSYVNSKNIGKIYNNYQFKVYHNTVVFNSKKFLESNIFKKEYGRRVDMLNLQYLSMKHGFCFLNKTVSEFTVRENQAGAFPISNDYLINELKFLKKKQKKFYKFFLKNNLHYELSIFSIHKILKNFDNAISIKYILRSIKFKLWKFLRFYLNPKLLNFLFKVFN